MIRWISVSRYSLLFGNLPLKKFNWSERISGRDYKDSSDAWLCGWKLEVIVTEKMESEKLHEQLDSDASDDSGDQVEFDCLSRPNLGFEIAQTIIRTGA